MINSSSKSVDRNATNQTGHQPYRFIISLTVLRFSRLSFALFHTLSVSFDHKIKRKANGRQKEETLKFRHSQDFANAKTLTIQKKPPLSQMTGKRNDSDNTTGKQRSDDHIRAYRSKNG